MRIRDDETGTSQVTLLDITAEALSLAREGAMTCERLNYVQGSILNLPFGRGLT